MQWVKVKFNEFHSWLWAHSFLTGMALIGIGVVYGVFGSYHPVNPAWPTTITEYGAFGDYFGGLINPLMAFLGFGGLLLTIRQQGKAARDVETKHDDEKYIEHAVKCLERAYWALLEQNANCSKSTKQDRLAWLTCARLILSSEDAFARVSSEATALRVLYEGEREHWRREFYVLLGLDKAYGDLKSAKYFEYWTDDASSQQIEPRSIRVIVEFVDWPKGLHDPIDAVPEYTDKEIDAMNGSLRGVREYLSNLSARRHARAKQPNKDKTETSGPS